MDLAGQIEHEYTLGKANKAQEISEFESYIDLLDAERTEKEYDWKSDVFIPEFPSHMHTQASIDADQYFSTRDFVEVYIQDESDQAIKCAEASKELINRTLNQRHLSHYQKFMRAKLMNHVGGYVYAKCWWEQELRDAVVDQREEVDEFGNLTIIDVMGKVPYIDRFNYDIIDPRNVFTSNEYCYSLQQKEWIIIRTEKSMSELKKDKARMGYINLDKIGIPPDETETSQETYNKYQGHAKPESVDGKFDILERYGKHWAIVTSRRENGVPLKAKPGLDAEGNLLPGAELVELIITYAINKTSKTLIRFQPQPNVDAQGQPYKPLIRGVCYIHPTNDNGVGDGKYSRELQIAINDTANVSNDRTMLATMPVFVGRKYSMEDNSSLYIEPMHFIEAENVDDFRELPVQDNTMAAMAQIAMYTGKMQQVTSIHPPTMGGQAAASNTATAIAGAEQHTNIRTNYKSKTFENTFLVDFYWMIQQMTLQFAKAETGFKLLGEKVYDFDPTKDYYYKPLSQSVETEQSKNNKIKNWMNVLQSAVQMQHPDAVKIVNYIFGQIFKYMGDEFVNFGNKMLDEKKPMEGGQQQALGNEGPSNQYGLPQTALEQYTRGT